MKKNGMQRKLAIGASNDPLEQEADRIAEQVTAGPIPSHVNVAPPRIQRFTGHTIGQMDAPVSVDRVLASSGRPLEPALQRDMGQRFGYDFSQVRVHTGTDAEQSARDVHAHAYTVGNEVVFGAGQFTLGTYVGRRLIAHELTHVVQQSGRDVAEGIDNPNLSSIVSGRRAAQESPASEVDIVRAADEAVADRPAKVMPAAAGIVLQRRAAPYIKKVTVHLTPPQTADLEWQGTPPPDATGSDHFTVSTGKGYGDPGDPPGTCTRDCCSDPLTQCAPPWNRPDRVGACCTYYGNSFWTGRPLEEHNGWKWWTPIQPWYSSRGIALHQHTEVTGQPIGHGCVRMDEPNAKRIYDYSNGARTNVTVDGRAAPVACDEDRRCGATTGTRGDLEMGSNTGRLTMREPAIPGLEGAMT
ncbi:MAG: DUF4157 domain-containing protein [Nitrospira sp.]